MTNLGNRLVPSLLVRDLRETLDFYEGVLGFCITGLNGGRAGGSSGVRVGARSDGVRDARVRDPRSQRLYLAFTADVAGREAHTGRRR